MHRYNSGIAAGVIAREAGTPAEPPPRGYAHREIVARLLGRSDLAAEYRAKVMGTW